MHISSNEHCCVNNNVLLFFKESPIPPIPPIHYFFQKFTETHCKKLLKDLEEANEEEDKHKIFCKNCGYPVTSREKKREVNGQHQHIFHNPAGIFYEIGCFSAASGCMNYGTPTFEHSWFTGFMWCYALCTNCFIHLGWFFQSGEDDFYGLILNNLEEVGSG